MQKYFTLREGKTRLSRIVPDDTGYGRREDYTETVWFVTDHQTAGDAVDFSRKEWALDYIAEVGGEDYIVGDGPFRSATTNPDFPLTADQASEWERRVSHFLPRNFKARLAIAGTSERGLTYVGIIEGVDSAGWTLDGYIIPRLASGNIFVTELEVA